MELPAFDDEQRRCKLLEQQQDDRNDRRAVADASNAAALNVPFFFARSFNEVEKNSARRVERRNKKTWIARPEKAAKRKESKYARKFELKEAWEKKMTNPVIDGSINIGERRCRS